MPKTGDINVRITADDSDFKRKIRSFNQKMAGVRRNVNRSALAFGAFAAAGTAAFTAIVNSQRKTIDALAKSADALAITTENLQALNHIAELNGVSSESMAKGLMRMQKALGEAARKGGTSADALKDAGLSIQSIINLSPDEQMQKISDALGNIENQAIKSSIASDLFGRSVGNNMLKVLTQLRKEGVEPTAEKLEALGVSISRVDAARVEAANDALFTSQQVISGIANTITIELSDYIKVLSDRFNDAAEASDGFGDEVKAAIESGLMSAAKFLDFLYDIRLALLNIEKASLGLVVIEQEINDFNIAAEKAENKATNWLVDAANSAIKFADNLVGINIPMLAPPESDLKHWEKLRDESNKTFDEIAAGIAKLEGRTPAIDRVQAFIDDAKKAGELAAAGVSGANGNIAGGGGESGVGGEDSNVLPFKGQPTGSIDTASDEFGFNPIEDPFDPEAIAAKNEELLQLDRDFWTNKGAIVDHGLTSITSMIEQKQGKQAGAYANSFASILSSTASYSKKAFEINKKFALGEAVVKGFQSATAAWSAGMSTGGPQAPFVAAAYLAASLAKTGAQIKAIKAQSFGGGGSGSAGGGTGGASGALPGASAPQQAPQRANTAITVNLQGESFSRGGVESLFETINNGLDQGYSIRVAS